MCSYLLHEEESLGLRAFVQYIPIGHYLRTRVAMAEPAILSKMEGLVDLEASKRRAIEAQKDLNPKFDVDHDRLKRGWTDLDLHSMS